MRFVPVATVQQDDIGSGADAAHSDHAASGVHHLEALQKSAPMRW